MPEERRQGQEGSRWINVPPTGEELSKWFKENVSLHDGLQHDDYVQGITMIPQKEKAKAVVGWNADNRPVIEEVENLVFIPYMKVETRVKYFQDLMAQNPDWMGTIEPVPTEEQDPRVPTGFFPFSIRTGENKAVSYIACTMKVTVYDRETVENVTDRLGRGRAGSPEMVIRRRVGKTIIDAPPATKMVPLLGYNNRPESFALMKAETGAIGRALGMAGMLVIPGTGVATAEDLQEADELEERPPAADPEEAKVPQSPEQQAAQLRNEAMNRLTRLQNEFPERHKQFQAWAKDRGFGQLSELDPTALRGVVTKLTRELQEAAQDATEQPTTEQETDADAN